MIKKILNLFRRNPIVVIRCRFDSKEEQSDFNSALKKVTLKMQDDYHFVCFSTNESKSTIQMFSTKNIEPIEIESLLQMVKELPIKENLTPNI